MDQYFAMSRSPAGGRNATIKKSSRYTPYGSTSSPTRPKAASDNTLRKEIFKTLGEEGNPITGSKKGEHADHVSSTATGHQHSELGGHRKSYFVHHNEKLTVQRDEEGAGKDSAPASQILKNVRVYIGGFLQDTTDIEMKRIVTLAGGQIMHTASGATHIVTSQQLSGSKTQRALKSESRSKAHVVRPEWVTDSIAAGRRRSERAYSVLKDSTTTNLTTMFARKTPGKS